MIELNGNNLTIELLRRIADGEKVGVSGEVIKRVSQGQAWVERLVANERVVYGITTGFGHLCETRVKKEDIERLQTNLLRSHATGIGEPFSHLEARAIVAIRLNSLLHGVSGVRPNIIQALLDLLNNDIIPWIPQKGSVGSSGDLAPLSHMALVLIGEGHTLVEPHGREPAFDALKRAGLAPIKLAAKEGLALINGTAVMTAVLALSLGRGLQFAQSADIIASLTLDVMKASLDPFDADFISLRPYMGMEESAANVRSCLDQSEILSSQTKLKKVQDAYSFRCIPQVHGATRETLNFLISQVTIELNSVTDNPVLLSEDKIISGGNFHGQPMAFASDFFGIAMAELANISERRIDRLLNPLVSGMSPFLSINPGVNSGLMIVQYTAASLVSENKVLAHPASVDSIPTSAYQEDHVSMGTIAARKGAIILDHCAWVLAIEWICASQAYEFIKPLALGKGTKPAYELLRREVQPLDEDRILSPDIEKAHDLIWRGELLSHVSKIISIS